MIHTIDDVSRGTLEAFQGFENVGGLDIQLDAKIAILLSFKVTSVIIGLILITHSSQSHLDLCNWKFTVKTA